MPDVRADGREVVVGEAGSQPSAIGLGAFCGVVAECEVGGVGRYAGIGDDAQVRVCARPAVSLRRIDHRRANRVQFDVPVQRQQIAFGVDQARSEAAFPQRAGAMMATVERRHVALVEQSHRRREVVGVCGGDQQMDVIAHERVGVDADVMGRGDFGQKFAIEQVVFDIDEDRASIHPALGDVKRNAGDEQAWTTRHAARTMAMRGASMAGRVVAVIGRVSRLRVRKRRDSNG